MVKFDMVTNQYKPNRITQSLKYLDYAINIKYKEDEKLYTYDVIRFKDINELIEYLNKQQEEKQSLIEGCVMELAELVSELTGDTENE